MKESKKRIAITVTIIIMISIAIFIIFYANNNANKSINDNINEKQSKSEILLEKVQNKIASSKEIEELFKLDKNNEEYRTIYYYDSAKYYKDSMVEEKVEGMSNIEKEKYYMMRISPEYNKILADEIVKFGINLFGNKEEWSKQYEIGKQINERQNKMYNGDYKEAVKVYNYIDNKYNQYFMDNYEDADDEYSSELFQEVSNKFGITILEANDIWGNPIFDVEKASKEILASSNK